VFHDWNHPNMMHFAVNYQDNGTGNDELQSFILLLQTNIQKFLKVKTIIAVGHSVRGLSKVKHAYISSLLVWSQNSLGPLSEIIWHAKKYTEKEVEYSLESEKKLTLLIENHDIEGVSNLLRKLLTAEQYTLKALSQFVLKVYLLIDGIAKRNGIRSPQIQRFFMMIPDIIRRFNSVEQVLDNLTEMASELICLLKTTKVTGGASIVETIRQYIDQNYANEIGLAMLADRFYINPTYLSELFKKHVGQTFSEYVIQVRITKTEKLLHDTSLRLSDIAELVGFSNASYLSSVFKKHYGLSPNDYRSTLPSQT
jgi:two-component system response regulator YesN